MKIKRFEAEDVNGYLNFKIDFNDQLTFLIGINGSGKTTAIKLILGLLSPSWVNLTQIKYRYAEVECKLNEDTLLIKSEYIDQEKIKLHVIYADDQKENISSTVKVQDIASIKMGDLARIELRQIMNRYSRYESHFSELDAVKKIRELMTPIFLGLDRRIHEGSEIDLLNIDSFIKERDIPDRGNLYESLVDVEELIKNTFLEYSQRQTAISNDLKNGIIYSSFDIIEEKESDDLGFNLNPNIDSKKRKNRIIEASKNFEIPGLEQKIVEYFDELSRIHKNLKEESNKDNKKPTERYLKILRQWFINSPQLQRIDKIISLCETAQNKIENEYQSFIKFENLTNRYFSDSNKRLKIKKNGIVEIELPNGKYSNIYKLSSGEQQIIVMLAQLIFGTIRQIFIIDEPELSLHIGWQELFVDSIMKSSPDTQFILATHSPSIIGRIDNEQYCVDLSYNTLKND